MTERLVPYRISIYWKTEWPRTGPRVVVYSFGSLIRLNQTASIIWELMDGHHSEEQLSAALQVYFPDMPVEQLRQDVDRFLSFAEDKGLIMRRWHPLQPYQVLCEELAS